MQLYYFTNGGYVVHKAYLCGTKYSVWFDDFGQFNAAERFDRRGRSYGVSPTSIAAKSLQAIYGNRHNFADWNKSHCVHA